MKNFNIYLIGVGGQGIGLLSEVITRAIDYSGQKVLGVDTHGLAQRGGTVSSHIRIGEAYTPLNKPGEVDLVIALEIHEALRGLAKYLKVGGTLVYYSTSWQPLSVRLGKDKIVTEEELIESAKNLNAKIFKVFEELEDVRMQNTAVLKVIDMNNLIPNVKTEHYLSAMNDLMNEKVFEKNRELFLRR